MPMTYQEFLRYVAGNTDSEVLTVYCESEKNEMKFVNNAMEYLGRKWGGKIVREYTPNDWCKKGKKLDIVKLNDKTKHNEVEIINSCMEAKFLVRSEGASYAKSILEDLFRIISFDEQTTQKTQRFLLIAGKRTIFEKVWQDYNMDQILPLEYNNKFGNKKGDILQKIFGRRRKFLNREIDVTRNKLGGVNVSIDKFADKLKNITNSAREKIENDFEISFSPDLRIDLAASYCPRGDFEPAQDGNTIDVRLWRVKGSFSKKS